MGPGGLDLAGGGATTTPTGSEAIWSALRTVGRVGTVAPEALGSCSVEFERVVVASLVNDLAAAARAGWC